MVVAHLSVALPLVEVDDRGILKVLRYGSLCPYHFYQLGHFVAQLWPSMFVDLCWDCISSWSLARGQLVNGFLYFSQRGTVVQVGVGLLIASSLMCDVLLRTASKCSAHRSRMWDFSVSNLCPSALSSGEELAG